MMEIEKDALIIDELVDLLENGGIPPGGKLPSENTLAERYRVPAIPSGMRSITWRSGG